MVRQYSSQEDVGFGARFGKCLKLGVHEDSTNRTKVAELLRYHTSKSGDEQISLKEYVDRMKEGQNDIFYITGRCIDAMSQTSRHDHTLNQPKHAFWPFYHRHGHLGVHR